jgi:hypothetical protein
MRREFWREKLALAVGAIAALVAFLALARGEPLPAQAAEPAAAPTPVPTATPGLRPLLPAGATRVPTATPAPAESPEARPALPAPGRSHARTRTS